MSIARLMGVSALTIGLAAWPAVVTGPVAGADPVASGSAAPLEYWACLISTGSSLEGCLWPNYPRENHAQVEFRTRQPDNGLARM